MLVPVTQKPKLYSSTPLLVERVQLMVPGGVKFSDVSNALKAMGMRTKLSLAATDLNVVIEGGGLCFTRLPMSYLC